MDDPFLGEWETVAFANPVSASPSLLLPPPEEEAQPVYQPKGDASDALLSKKEAENQHAPSAQILPVASVAEALSPAMITVDHAITLFLQGKHTENWEPKTQV